MYDITKILFKKGVLKEKEIFIIHQMFKKGISFISFDIVNFLEFYINKMSEEKITEEYWRQRKEIIVSDPRSSLKIALCIYCDLIVNDKCDASRVEKLKLITTTVIKHNMINI